MERHTRIPQGESNGTKSDDVISIQIMATAIYSDDESMLDKCLDLCYPHHPPCSWWCVEMMEDNSRLHNIEDKLFDIDCHVVECEQYPTRENIIIS